VTEEQNKANVRSAERIVAISFGIDDQGGDLRTTLSYDERVTFDKAVAAYIVAHPAAFLPATVATAQFVTGQNLTPLQDASFDLGSFVSETVANGTKPFVAVGDGVLSVANASKWAIPAVAVVVVIIGLLALFRRSGAAAS